MVVVVSSLNSFEFYTFRVELTKSFYDGDDDE